MASSDDLFQQEETPPYGTRISTDLKKSEVLPDSITTIVERRTMETLEKPPSTVRISGEHSQEKLEEFYRILDITHKKFEEMGVGSPLSDDDLKKIKDSWATNELETQNALSAELFRHPVFIVSQVCAKFFIENNPDVPVEDVVEHLAKKFFGYQRETSSDSALRDIRNTHNMRVVGKNTHEVYDYFRRIFVPTMESDSNLIHQLYYSGRFDELHDNYFSKIRRDWHENAHRDFLKFFPELEVGENGRIVLKSLNSEEISS